MGSQLKNVLLTALYVVGATMATSSVAAIGLSLTTSDDAASSAELLFNLGAPIIMIAALIGLLCSPISLLVAAVTMPPALGLTHALKAPRPLFDIVGGAAAGLVTGLLYASMVTGILVSLARSKGGAPPDPDDVALFFAGFGVLGGSALGYLRHAVLVRKYLAAPAPQFA